MKKVLLSTLMVCSMAIAAIAAQYADITREELKTAISSGKVTLLDVNGSESYAAGHIPGAVDFTAKEASLATLLPADKHALIVAYCGGEKCKAYLKGADAAAKLGYTNVRHFAPGIHGWKEAGEKMETK